MSHRKRRIVLSTLIPLEVVDETRRGLPFGHHAFSKGPLDLRRCASDVAEAS